MKTAILVAVLLLAAASAATPTGAFMARWEAASRAPEIAGRTAKQTLATPDLKTLLEEFVAVAAAYRRQILEARTAGTPPRACPPARVDLTIDDVLAKIRTLPETWRSRDFADSFGAVMDARYPCTAA